MTTTTPTAADIFADAKLMHREALERLEAGDVRDAAEKAWCATLRATAALILARTGEEPFNTTATRHGLDALAAEDSAVKVLVGRYHTRQTTLHGDCFYLGLPPTPDTLRRIRETDRFITDAERLAAGLIRA